MKKRMLALIMVLVLVFASLPVDAANITRYKISGNFGEPGGFIGDVGNLSTKYNGGYYKTTVVTKKGTVLKDDRNVTVQPTLFGGYYMYTESYDDVGALVVDEVYYADLKTGQKKIIKGSAGDTEFWWMGLPYNDSYRVYSEHTDFTVMTFGDADGEWDFYRNTYIYDAYGNRVHEKPVKWIFDRGNLWIEVAFTDGTIEFLNRQTWEAKAGFVEGCYDNVGGGYGARPIDDKTFGVYNDKGELQFTYTADDWQNPVWDMDWKGGYAPVYKKIGNVRYFGLIDPKGNFVLPMEYAYIMNPEDGLIRAAQYTDRWKDSWDYGLIDIQGNVIMDFKYWLIEPFKNGVAQAKRNNYEADFIDRQGNVLVDTVRYFEGYNSLGDFNVCIKEDKVDYKGYYLTDSKGNRISGYYDYIGPMNEGLSVVSRGEYKKEKVGYIDYTGREIIPLVYTHPSQTTSRASFLNDSLPGFSSGATILSIGKQGYVIHNPLMTEGVTANKNAAKLLVDGKVVNVDAYNIGGSNYFKLRDIAAMLTGSGKSFNVVYNSNKGCVEIKRNAAYTPTATDLVTGGKDTVNAKYALPIVYADGAMVNVFNESGRQTDGLTAYNIDGSNYFKLRDLGQFIDFAVGYSTAENCISIDTTKSYR